MKSEKRKAKSEKRKAKFPAEADDIRLCGNLWLFHGDGTIDDRDLG